MDYFSESYKNHLKKTLKIGDKVYPIPMTCSRYGNIVGEVQSIDGDIAHVLYPAIPQYGAASYSIYGVIPSGSYNPFKIYHEAFTASLWIGGIVLASDQSVPIGTLL
jgi:hypothetical protein